MKSDQKLSFINVRLEDSVKQDFDKICRDNFRSMSQVLRELVHDHIKQHQGNSNA